MKSKFFLFLLALLPAVLHAAEPLLISKTAGKTVYWANGTVNNGPFGGGTGLSDWFNDVLDDNVYFGPNNRANNGSYVVLDFTGQMPAGGYFITDIAISEQNELAYSLYYSVGGTEWTAVKDGVGISGVGTKTVSVNETATHVKVVFNVVGGWTPGVCEIQVYGMDPADVECRHPTYTEWQSVSGSATCTTVGKECRKCTVCGEEFERDAEQSPPLGHDYVSTLATPGASSRFGSGTLSCSRCDWSATFNVPLDLASLGGVSHRNLIQFTDLSVSSSVSGAGVGAKDLIDNDWSWEWAAYWIAETRGESEYVQYDFGTEIDLTKIEYSSANRNQTLKFYKWDGENEVPLAEVAVVKDGSGREYQRGSIEFRGVVAKGIRLHIVDPTGEGYNGARPVAFSELHPYGTVVGAGKLDVVRTRILLY